MAPSASTEELRVAYRGLARRLHPDRLIDASSAERHLAERRMREINEAWHVLQNPVARRRYDDGRLQGRNPATARAPRTTGRPASNGAGIQATEGDDDLVDVLPPMTALTAGLMRHLPWVALVVVFGLIFVVSAYAGSGDPLPKPRAGAAAGSCLDVRPGPETSVVPCSGPHELKVVRRVVEAAACPSESEPRRFGNDNLIDCVVPT